MKCGGQPTREPVKQFGAGEQIRHDPLRAEVGVAAGDPPVPHRGEVVDQLGRVHVGEPGVVELARRHDVVAESAQGRFDDGDAFGDLGARGGHTYPDLRPGVVVVATRVDDQRNPPRHLGSMARCASEWKGSAG